MTSSNESPYLSNRTPRVALKLTKRPKRLIIGCVAPGRHLCCAHKGFIYQLGDDQCGFSPNTASSVRFAPGREVASTASPSILTALWSGRESEDISKL